MHQKVVIYRRQSRDRAHDELGIERQLEECQRLCELRGRSVQEVITDNDVSASKHGREGYKRLIDMVERGAVDTIVILRVDRLLRLNDELEDLIQLSEKRGTSVATVEGDIDLATPSGRLVARLLVSVARAEIETKSARHRLAKSQAARAGKDNGGERPYGYEPDRVTVRESEAVVLREMVDRYLKGHSTTEIAWWLNSEGHPMARGGKWSSINVRNLLKRKRIGGIRVHNGAEYPAVWPAIIDKRTFERLQLEIQLRAEHPSSAPKAGKYLLTGLVYCAKCGKPMNGNIRKDHPDKPKKRYYVCRMHGNYEKTHGCGRTRRYAVPLEHFIREAVMYRLDTPDLAKQLQAKQNDNGQLAQLLEERQALQSRLGGFADDYAMGLLNRSQLARANQTAEVELRRLDDRISALTARNVVKLDVGETLRTAWEKSESDEWRRRFLSLLIERIDLLPGRDNPPYDADGVRCRFDPDRVAITWKV